MNYLHPLKRLAPALCALLLAACAHTGDKNRLGAPLTAVNYTDWPFDWVGVAKPETPDQAMAAERVSAFSAGGIMCCVSLPEKWYPGLELIVQTQDGTRAKSAREWGLEKIPIIQHRVPVPPYTHTIPHNSIDMSSLPAHPLKQLFASLWHPLCLPHAISSGAAWQ